ncbi:MAG: S9 family peptidase [Acidobacteriota bacterium]|nr:S9 family peptidase [Acidobacteriota bacterium]
MKPAYPPARPLDLVDDYHGTPVPDPYRWLEEAEAPETVAWVAAENELTRSRLDGPAREALIPRLTALHRYARTSAPVRRGSRWFYTRNDGQQNQAVLLVREVHSTAPARALVDPNVISADGTTALTAFEPDDDGRRVVYGLSRNGSDRQELFVHDVDRGVDLDDRLLWAKFVSLAWLKDGSGFFYTRFPEPGTVPEEQENYFCRLCFHRLGDPQSADRVVHERPDDPMIVFEIDLTDDGRHLVVVARHGASDKSEVWIRDLHDPQDRLVPIFTGFEAAWHFVGSHDDRFFFITDAGAPLGRLVSVRPTGPDFSSVEQVEVVGESADRLSAGSVAGGQLVTVSMHDAADRMEVRSLDGTFERTIPLPEPGSILEFSGRAEDLDAFVQFTSFTRPPSVFRVGVSSGAVEEWDPLTLAIDPVAYETQQVWLTSKDGTRVPMFLVHRLGVTADGARPVLLGGYGGFNISLTPEFDPGAFVWLDRGGVMAVVNLRGGGEFGEAWHEAGMLARKQNVFDDFIAAAEWLVSSGWSRPDRIAIEGGSNGGLLVGAVMTQRPELFGAVVCRVPVADMLRYHLWTVGRFWIAEYGCADDPEQFRWLYAYSPYHNVRAGTAYPPTLVMTADTDDRVAPGMAKKFAARLQAATSSDAPVLIRVETRAGHGAGKSIARKIEEEADIYAFLFRYLRGGWD